MNIKKTNPHITLHTVLYMAAFVNGFVLLGMEMAGSRILAPYWGSSIYVWAGLIAVILSALSLGNITGGRMADHRPSAHLLFMVMAGAGIWIMALSVISNPICILLSSIDVDIRISVLLICIVLFGMPSLLLGMTTPFIIRLGADSIHDLGRWSGNTYALSTLGSIAGTLVVSFLLIPVMGMVTILLILGVSPFLFGGVVRLLKKEI